MKYLLTDTVYALTDDCL